MSASPRGLSVGCVMMAKRINQRTDTRQIPGSAPDWPKANTSSAAANRRRLSTASPQLMSPVARRLSDPSVGESQLILVSVIP